MAMLKSVGDQKPGVKLLSARSEQTKGGRTLSFHNA